METVGTEMLLLLLTFWAAFFMTNRAAFLAVWTALLRTAGTEYFKENRAVPNVFARSFCTACSLNFEAMFEILVATLWAALIADGTVVVLFAHSFGTDTHSVKAALIVDARRTIEDAMRNVIHLIGVVLCGNQFVADLRNDDTCFHFIWCQKKEKAESTATL